jgi:CRP-like cAMP-binding protein
MASYKGLKTFPADHLLFKEGDDGTDAFLLIDGNVKLYRGRGDKPAFEHVLQGRPKTPQLVGKAALLGEKYQVSARAVTAVSVVPISRASFSPLMDKADPLLRMMLIALLQDVVLVYSDPGKTPR